MSEGHNLAFFNGHIAAAQSELRGRAAYRSDWGIRFCIETARAHMRHALSYANQIGCASRKAMCLRILNWLNAELRRLPE